MRRRVDGYRHAGIYTGRILSPFETDAACELHGLTRNLTEDPFHGFYASTRFHTTPSRHAERRTWNAASMSA
jgi:hypothetical protein